jgi:hypothetical protein
LAFQILSVFLWWFGAAESPHDPDFRGHAARTIGITNTTLIIFVRANMKLVELFVNLMRLWRTQYVDRWQAWKIHRLPEILPRGLAQLVGD